MPSSPSSAGLPPRPLSSARHLTSPTAGARYSALPSPAAITPAPHHRSEDHSSSSPISSPLQAALPSAASAPAPSAALALPASSAAAAAAAVAAGLDAFPDAVATVSVAGLQQRAAAAAAQGVAVAAAGRASAQHTCPGSPAAKMALPGGEGDKQPQMRAGCAGSVEGSPSSAPPLGPPTPMRSNSGGAVAAAARQPALDAPGSPPGGVQALLPVSSSQQISPGVCTPYVCVCVCECACMCTHV